MEVPIPGYSSSSGIDTQKIIKDLVEVERKPIVKLEERIENSKQETRLWNNLEKDMRQFQTYAKRLYGFQNPFDERSATSSNEAILTVEAARGAQRGEHEVLVKQIAAADVWASDPVLKSLQIPQGAYTFAVGEHSATLDFAGGDVEEFVKKFAAQVDKKLLVMRAVQRGVDKKYTTLVLESKKLGKKFALSLSDDAEQFSHDLGFQTYSEKNTTQPFTLNAENITRVLSDPSFVEKKAETFSALKPGGIVHLTLPNSFLQSGAASKNEDALLKLEFERQPFKEEAQSALLETSSIGDALKATVEDVTVLGTSKSIEGMLEKQAPREQEAAQELSLVFSADASKSLYAFDESTDVQENIISIEIPLSDIRDVEGHASFIAANPFPNYRLVLQSARFQAAGGENAVVVKNPISRARNAVVQLSGVDMERETNAIDDMLPGLTLRAKRSSDEVVLVSVQNDEQLIKDFIINFVGSYNQMMKKMAIYTSNDIPYTSKDIQRRDSVLDLLEFESDGAREQAEKDLGRLSGNFSLIRLTNSLVTAMSRQYPNARNSEITLLRNIGIASHLSDPSARSTRLGNRFLDIDETVLDEALAKYMEDVAELFGSDQNNDLVIEEGVAFASAELVQPFIITGGIASQKRTGLQRDIQDNRTQISRYEKRVKDFREKITRDFATMERSLSKLEDASSALKGLQGTGSQ